jgi:hypothetical protein
MYKTQGPGLLDLVLEAHGGIERWSKAKTIHARLNTGGPTWTALGQEKIFADLDCAVDVHEQRTVLAGRRRAVAAAPMNFRPYAEKKFAEINGVRMACSPCEQHLGRPQGGPEEALFSHDSNS